MIKLIMSDLSEVYLNGLKEIDQYLGKGWKPSINNSLLRTYLEDGITEDFFWSGVKKENQWADLTINDLKTAVRNCFTVYDPDYPPIIEKLRQHYNVILVSDHGREWVQYIESKKELRVVELFPMRFYSFQLGDIKRGHGLIFKKPLELLGVEGKEALLIDDSPINLAKAKEFGINTVLFKNSKQLVNDLRSLEIKL